jgi:hypothetical protein
MVSAVPRLLSAFVIVLALSACGGGDDEVTPAAAPEQACSPAGARQTVDHVVSALDAGDLESLDRAFARSPVFRWYSTESPGTRLDAEAQDRATLLRYLEGRSRANERLEVTSFEFRGRSGSHALFEVDLTRSADDLEPTPYVVRGAISCDAQRGTLAAWAMARA